MYNIADDRFEAFEIYHSQMLAYWVTGLSEMLKSAKIVSSLVITRWLVNSDNKDYRWETGPKSQ